MPIKLKTKGDAMLEVMIEIILYADIVFGFISFGRFLKECDQSMRAQMKK